MINPVPFLNLNLRGGFVITRLEFADEQLLDALGREAAAQTTISGKEFRLLIRGGMSERELSVTLYHEILEAASVGSTSPPSSVIDFNEADFEKAAQEAHQRFGLASPANLDAMLQSFGFS